VTPDTALTTERRPTGVGGFSRLGAEQAAALDRSPFIVETPAPEAVRRRDSIGRRWLLAADVLAALSAVIVVQGAFGQRAPGNAGLVLPLIVPLVFTAMGLYKRDEIVMSRNTLDEAPVVFQAATLSAVGAYFVQSALIAKPLGAQLIAASLVALTGAVLLLRVIARAAARRMSPYERCLLIGGADVGARLASKLESEHAVKARLVARLELARGTRVTHDLARLVREADVHRVLVAGEGAPPERVHDAIQAAKALGVKVSVLPRMFEVVGSSVAFDYVGGMTVLGVRRFGLDSRQRLVKRSLDLGGSALLLVLLAPVMVALALAVRLASPGPTLFRQTRVGRNGHHFKVFKFRSMVADAEARKAELHAHNEADGLFKIENDPRITRVGRFLRRTSLDELPQLLNVVRGEMSLVGPRPLVVDEDVRVEGFYRRRLHLTPGMTGPWQVLGSARIPLREMVSIDYLYVANWSLWEDIKILLRTVPVVVGRRGQ
jgi:exopolysaccharide biosynthesis polyprenyl glycosylphosphotransferase